MLSLLRGTKSIGDQPHLRWAYHQPHPLFSIRVFRCVNGFWMASVDVVISALSFSIPVYIVIDKFSRGWLVGELGTDS